MPCFEKLKHGSFFLKQSSSFARQTVHITFLLMLLPSMSFSQATKRTRFCFDTREGHRLNATVHKKLHAWHEVDCVLKCLDDTCCRSVNCLKTLDFGQDEDDNKDNCELLHDAVVSGKNDNLVRNDDYDYFIMKNPERSFNCSCLSCEKYKTCNASSQKCECQVGFKGSQCEADIDECISKPCDTNATCENFVGSYNCTCKKGFTGNGTTCTDIDECISKPCDINATCDNFVGSYNCTCKEGFTGDGTNCTGYASCTAIKTENVTTSSGLYNINPRGIGFSSFKVDCNMTSKNGVGVTVIGHDSEARMEVDGYENPGSYSRKIKYDLPIELVTAIIKTSMKCEQFIKYECHDSVFKFSLAHYAWWVSRQGAKMDYWGGAAANSKQCACGMTNSCAGGGPCNCDANDKVLREDSGFLTDKNTLPVTELRFGDTGDSTEYGYHTLGKLMCWG